MSVSMARRLLTQADFVPCEWELHSVKMTLKGNVVVTWNTGLGGGSEYVAVGISSDELRTRGLRAVKKAVKEVKEHLSKRAKES